METQKQSPSFADVVVQATRASKPKPLSQQNTYGEITFSDCSKKAAKYVRVKHDESLLLVRDLLLDTWKLPRPKLIISVTGGAKAANLSPRLEREFRLGIVKAARNTRAWLVTGGTNTGIMQQVGKAVREHGMTSRTGERVPLIGIVPWGKVHNRTSLDREAPTRETPGRTPSTIWSRIRSSVYTAIEAPQQEQRRPVEYKIEKCKGEVCLDSNHSYFLLVDDNTENYRGEIKFRTALEKEMSTVKGANGQEGETKVPVVLLVVNGGVGTLENVSRALSNGTPAVVMKGSGRAADALAFAYEETRKGRSFEDIEKDVLELLKLPQRNQEDEENKRVCLKCLKESLQHAKLILVYELKKFSSARDMDAAILEALFQVNHENEDEKLRLALIWNRADFARDRIAMDKIKSGRLQKYVKLALVQDRPDFLDLFLEAGVTLEHLDNGQLVSLYTEPDQSDISVLVKGILEKLKKKMEGEKKEGEKKEGEKKEGEKKKGENEAILKNALGNLLLERVGFNYFKPQGNASANAEQRVKKLLLWAVLMNRPEMAKLFWKRINEKTTAALVVSAIFRALSEYDQETIYLRGRFQELAEEWSQLAVFVLKKCYETRDSRTHELLVWSSASWGNSSCIVTALRSYDKHFTAQPACQDLRQKIWTGYWPGMVPKTSSLQPDDGTVKEELGGKLYKRLSPRVVFYTQVIFYLAFLVLYSYIVLVDDWTRFSVVGYVVAAWVFAIFLDIPIQLFMDFKRLSSSWRVLELTSVMVFVVGFGMRLSGLEKLVEPAQIILSLGFIVFCMRFLFYFTISQKLGPKLIMIKKMLSDLAIFCAIFFIFVASYAIASEAILYPKTPLTPRLLYSVPRKAFWQIFGQFFLEDIEGSSPCTQDASAYSPGGDTRCPSDSGRYVAPILLGVHIVITNVLLLNLLIAIFTSSIERVQEEAEHHWHFLQTRGVYELTLRSPLPPPLNLLYYVFCLVWFVCNGDFAISPFQRGSNDDPQLIELIEWENDIADFYIGQMEYEEEETSSDPRKLVPDNLEMLGTSGQK